MTAKQDEKIKKNDLMELVYKQFQEAFDSVPTLKTSLVKLFAIGDKIDVVAQHQEQETTGTTQSKLNKQMEVAAIAGQVANNISSWAVDNNNAVVIAQTKLTVKKLEVMTQQKFVRSCKGLLDLAQTNANALVQYGNAPELVAELEQGIKDYTSLSVLPQKSIKDRTGDTQMLLGLFKELDDTMKQHTDKLVLNIQKKYPAAYNAYQAVRKPSKSGGEQTATPPVPAT